MGKFKVDGATAGAGALGLLSNLHIFGGNVKP